MSSAFHIHIGGAGCMIGSSLWKLYSKEQPDDKKGYIFEE
jgi:tubulin alpha